MNSPSLFFQRIINKLIKILTHFIANIFGFDIITGIKIRRITSLRHLGTNYGGWFIPSKFLNSESVCYCVGAGEDISFDVSLAKNYGSKVFIFDPTPRAIEHFDELKKLTEKGEKMPINNSNKEFYHLDSSDLTKIKFFEFGIWDKEEIIRFYAPQNPAHVSYSILNLQKTNKFFEAKVKPISSIMQSLNHKKISLLKLNVEGAEYNIINSIVNENIDIDIFCIVFDELNQVLKKSIVSRIKGSLEQLKKSNFIAIKKIGPAYTFINRKLEKSFR